MTISFESTGSFKDTEKFIHRMTSLEITNVLSRYGNAGVAALRSATPIDTGELASSWTFEISRTIAGWTLSWHNQNGSTPVPLAIMLQYGHGTGTGGYVVGRDYINPAIQPIFDKIATDVWKEVVRK